MTPSFFSNEESRKETWLLFAASLALCIEILVLLYQLRLISIPGTRSQAASEERPIGSLTLKERSVTSRASDSLSWYPLAGGDVIHLNDTVMTGSNARARIELKGSGELSLEADTLIRFSDERKWTGASGVVNLEVNQGTVRLKSEKAPVRLTIKNRRIDLQPDSEVLVEKSVSRAESEVQVAKGKALVSEESGASGSGVSVTEGERVSLPEGVGAVAPATPTKLKLESRAPRAGSRLFAKSEAEEVVLRWKGADGDQLEWDASSDFKNAQTRVASGEAKLELKAGRYHWRVRRGTRVSDGADFLVVPAVQYELRGPASTAKLKRTEKVRLDWEKIEPAAEYRVEVASDEAFTEVAFDETVKENSLELPILPSGKFFWRVRASSPEWGEWPVSPTRSFAIKAPLAAPKAKGARMLDGKPAAPPKKGGWLRPATDRLVAFAQALWTVLVPEAHAAEKSEEKKAEEEQAALVWEFNWEKIEGAAGYRLEISLDPKFKKVAIKKELKETTLSLALPGQRYYWRVAAFDEDKELGAYSRVQKVDAPNGRVQRASVRMPPFVVKAPPPPPPPPARSAGFGFLLPSWVRLGAGGGFVSQSVSGANESLASSGFPLGKFEGYLHRTIAGSELELGFGIQRLRYQTKDASIASFQPDIVASQWEAQLLYKGMFRWGKFPLTFGAAFRNLNDLHRVAVETAAVTGVSQVALLAGVSPWQGSSADAFWQTDLLLEVAPAGGAKGAGLWLRGRWGLWNLLRPLTAELQLLLHPSIRSVTAGSRSQVNLEASVALVIGGLFDVSPRWVD